MGERGRAAVKAKQDLKQRLVDHTEWPLAGWRQWAISGRVLPERCAVDIGLTACHMATPSGGATVRYQISMSHVACTLWTEDPLISIFQVNNVVRGAILPMVDYVGFAVRAHYELILDTCTSDEGVLQPVPVFEPIFEPPREGYLFKPGEQQRLDNILIPVAQLVPEAATAYHDLSQSLRWSARTMEYCRMALEAIRGYFDPEDSKLSWRKRHVAGENAMCETLKLSRKQLKKIESYAALGRHGSNETYVDWSLRKETAEFAWEALHRFTLYLAGADRSDWAEIS